MTVPVIRTEFNFVSPYLTLRKQDCRLRLSAVHTASSVIAITRDLRASGLLIERNGCEMLVSRTMAGSKPIAMNSRNRVAGIYILATKKHLPERVRARRQVRHSNNPGTQTQV
jgi:hypothetical protein